MSYLFSFLLALCSFIYAFSQVVDLEKIIKASIFHKNNYELKYRLYVPQASKDSIFPMLIFLHGAGERGTDNVKQLTHAHSFFDSLFHEEHPFIFVAPQCPPNERWVEVSWKLPFHTMPAEPSKALEATKLLIDSLIHALPVDTQRIYITGLSMGGFGVWDAISRWPNFFAAAMPLCGGGDEKEACRLVNIPILAIHGMLDKVVIPERTIHMFTAIQMCGGKNIQILLYPNVGHDVWKYAYIKHNLEWLFEQKK